MFDAKTGIWLTVGEFGSQTALLFAENVSAELMIR